VRYSVENELDYVVLRDKSGGLKRPYRGGNRYAISYGLPRTDVLNPNLSSSPASTSGSAPDLEFHSLDPAQAYDAAHEPDVLAVVPAMPMELIEPVKPIEHEKDTDTSGRDGDSSGNGGDADPSIAWGVKAVRAHESDLSGLNIVVAILDTGIDPTHPAFQGVKLERKNFTDGADDDVHGHGTHCAGTIFGRDIEGQRIGIARGISTAVIGKVLGPGGGDSAQIAKAIQWAIGEGANVISMSLGVDFPGYVAKLQSKGYPPQMATAAALKGYLANIRLFDALADLVAASESTSQPVLLISAAGNESRRKIRSDFVIPVSPPGIADGFISVGALANGGDGFAIADFSNINPTLVAPGVDIISAAIGGGLVSKSGTSMACPHVAGVAALWAQRLKSQGLLSAKQLTGRLIGSAETDRLKPGFKAQDIGSGLIHAPFA
jgi:subtilisin family serine protease